jgi:hypothetical protein
MSDDGSIGGMYRASLRLAAQTYERGASTARSAARSGELKRAVGLSGGADTSSANEPSSTTPATNNAGDKQNPEEKK